LRPRVSIVLPYYEGRRWLARAVDSIRRQTEPGWELLIVDDGSVDAAPGALYGIHDPRVRWLRIAHAGKGAALNQGVRHARADVICFLDQDDVMLPERLSVQLSGLRRHPAAEGVYSDYERRCEDGHLIDRFISRPVTSAEGLHAMAVGRSPVTMQTLLLRKPALEAVGGFSERPELTGLDDLEFFVRLFLSGAALHYVPGVVQSWTRHERNYSGSASFHDARAHWLDHLNRLAERHPALRPEVRHFRFHARTMRGIHFLGTSRPRAAVREFVPAVLAKPGSPNAYYLLLKSIVLALQAPARRSNRIAGPHPNRFERRSCGS